MEQDWRTIDEEENRCAIVLDTSYENKGRLLGAMAHALLGLSADPSLRALGVFVRYQDRENLLKASGFHYACLVLAARNQEEIKGIAERARRKEVTRSEVVEAMMIGTTAEQYELVRSKPAAEHLTLAIAMFGPTKTIKSVAGSLPLFRG